MIMWQIGQQLQSGKYTIREVLGVGRLSVTYRTETTDGRSMVIKAPNADAMQPADFERLQKLFRSEAFKLVQCKHPHIVKVKEPFEENGICCIPMEYIAAQFEWQWHWKPRIGLSQSKTGSIHCPQVIRLQVVRLQTVNLQLHPLKRVRKSSLKLGSL